MINSIIKIALLSAFLLSAGGLRGQNVTLLVDTVYHDCSSGAIDQDRHLFFSRQDSSLILSDEGTTTVLALEAVSKNLWVDGAGYRPMVQMDGKSYHLSDSFTLHPPEGIPYTIDELSMAMATKDIVAYDVYREGNFAYLPGQMNTVPIQNIRRFTFKGGNFLEFTITETEDKYLYNVVTKKKRLVNRDQWMISKSNAYHSVVRKTADPFDGAYTVLDTELNVVVPPDRGYESFDITDDWLVLYDGYSGVEDIAFFRGKAVTVPGKIIYCSLTNCTLSTDEGFGMMNQRGELLMSTSEPLQINWSGDTYSLKDGIYTLYDQTGSVVLRGAYDKVKSLGENRWEVVKDKVYSVVDEEGNEIISPDARFTYGFSVYRDFGNILIGGRYGNSFVVFDIDGEELLRFDLDADEVYESVGLLVGYPRSTLAALSVGMRKRVNPSDAWIIEHKEGGQYTYELVNGAGQRLLPGRYAAILPMASGDIFVVQTLAGKWGAIRIEQE